MKNFFKAYKYYMKCYYPPVFLAIIAVLMLIGLGFALFMKQPETAEDYMNKIQIISVGHVGVMLCNVYMMVFGSFKFFYSTSFAKQFHTTIPVFAVGSVLVGYDIISFIASAINFGFGFATDLMVWNAIATFAIIFYLIMCLNKSIFAAMLPVLGLVIFNSVKKTLFADVWGFGLPLYGDILITLGIYIFGGGILIMILSHWWNKSGRNLMKV